MELGFEAGKIPSSYLGLLLGKPIRSTQYGMLWKRGFIEDSQCGRGNISLKGGKLTLIQSSLSSLPIYCMSLFVIPRKVRLRLEEIQRDFLWEGGALEKKPHLVRWPIVCMGRKLGGFGIRVERKAFQVKFEGFNGGTWISITERSRGFVVSLGFGEEESGWLVEHLKKAVDLEASREFVAKRKPLVLVVPEGVKGYGWENLRKAIVFSPRLVCSRPRNGAVMPVGKWARAVVCESKGKIRDWCDVGKAIARRVGMKGMVFVTPFLLTRGVFLWILQGELSGFRARELNSEKRGYCFEEMVAKRELSH
ncbi:putative ribonuclease H protein [Vitis vinifera]|uniref:Putative ribonuclease H protein n=1 Tax=Vitis vinifera TaxID=29760 RepID=A0A438CRS0_VITVI|nr:putative ribonuclease H protein [Vitis vinifera]